MRLRGHLIIFCSFYLQPREAAAIEQMVIDPEPTSNNSVEQMVLDEEESEDDSPLLERFRGGHPSGSGSVRRGKSVFEIPAEQGTGRVADYFYRVEFQERGYPHIHNTSRIFFFDGNYLFCISVVLPEAFLRGDGVSTPTSYLMGKVRLCR